MRPKWVIARKEFVGVFTERTILLAVIIQVFVAGFSSFLVVGLSALFDPSALPSQTQLQLAIEPETAADGRLMALLRDEGLGIRRVESEGEAYALFKSGMVDGILIARQGEDPDGPRDLEVVLPDGDLRATLTLVQVKEALEKYERALRDERADRLVFEPVYVDTEAKAGSYAFVYSLLIPLLVFLPVVLAGALSADSLTEEVQRGTLPLLLASPATPSDVVEGKLFANVAIAPVLCAAWFLLLGLNGLAVPLSGALLIMALATAISFLMGLLACVIALATRDRNKAHVIYALAMFFVLALSLVLPTSPVNAVAVLAAGSAGLDAHLLVAVTIAAAGLGWLALRLSLGRTARWMSAG